MFKFLFIIVSKDSDYKISKEQISILEKNNNYKSKFIYILNNKKGLPEIYNEYIIKVRNTKDYDFLIFMHADVSLDLTHLCNHIIECSNKYDIIGLCGTSIINVSQSPLNWWTGSNPTPYAKWGCVTHGELGNQTSFFSKDRENITDHEVSCIDGLCIILCQKAIQSQITFDPMFLFDFYDTDFSFQAIMKYNLKIGVIIEKSLQHYSIGKSILSKDFLRHELDFRKKWNLEIPKNSKLEKLVDKI